jgi:hypothetical protein
MTKPDTSQALKITFEEARAVLAVQGIKVDKVNYVSLTELVPDEWDWFWDMIDCNSAPFSFGDNNFTMITGDRLAEWLEDCFEFWNEGANSTATKEAWDKFIGSIWMCNDADIFIDLET